MTKKEAYDASLTGDKIRHRLFAPHEFIQLINGKLVDERGNKMDFEKYWKDRQLDVLQDGWAAIKEFK